MGIVQNFYKISDLYGGFSEILSSGDRFGILITNIGNVDGYSNFDIGVGAFNDNTIRNDAGAIYLLNLDENMTVISFNKICENVGGFEGSIYPKDFWDISLSNWEENTLLVGAVRDDDGFNNSGAVYLLDFCLCLADFSFINNGLEVDFENQYLGANNYQWDFGDGFSSSDENPLHVYTDPGHYVVTLISSNQCDSDTISKYVDVLFDITFDIKSFLEGPYLNEQMNPFLNLFGYLPLNQPYNSELFNYLENDGGSTYSYYFSISADSTYGGLVSIKPIANGKFGMFSSNGYFDKNIENNDKNEIWVPQFEQIGYLQDDFNMNGQVDNDDRITKWNSNAGRSSMVELSVIRP